MRVRVLPARPVMHPTAGANFVQAGKLRAGSLFDSGGKAGDGAGVVRLHPWTI